MATPDYATWLTKQQAADTIGVSTKWVEQMAADGKLQQASYRRPDGGPRRAVYHPDDVARLARARQPEASAFVLPPAPAGNGNGHGRAVDLTHPNAVGAGVELAPAGVPARADVLQLATVFAAALQVASSQSSEKSDPTLFVTIPEAAAITGLSPTHLRRAIAAGQLKAIRDGAIKVRRRELEAL